MPGAPAVSPVLHGERPHTELLWGVWARTHQKQAVEDVKIAEQQAELTPEFQALYDKIMRDLQNLS